MSFHGLKKYLQSLSLDLLDYMYFSPVGLRLFYPVSMVFDLLFFSFLMIEETLLLG